MLIKCIECGNEYQDDKPICTCCGCPTEHNIHVQENNKQVFNQVITSGFIEKPSDSIQITKKHFAAKKYITRIGLFLITATVIVLLINYYMPSVFYTDDVQDSSTYSEDTGDMESNNPGDIAVNDERDATIYNESFINGSSEDKINDFNIKLQSLYQNNPDNGDEIAPRFYPSAELQEQAGFGNDTKSDFIFWNDNDIFAVVIIDDKSQIVSELHCYNLNDESISRFTTLCKSIAAIQSMILFSQDYITNHPDVISRVAQFIDGRNYQKIGDTDLEYELNIAEDVKSMMKYGSLDSGETIVVITTTFEK